MVALPTVIGNWVERMVCQHRRERKNLLEKKPCGWMDKLKTVNGQTLSMCWSRKTCSMATPAYVKWSTRILHGEMSFVNGAGKGHELLHLKFSPADMEDPAGRGTYQLSSLNYPARTVCCVNAAAERNGFDLLREAYAGWVCELMILVPSLFFLFYVLADDLGLVYWFLLIGFEQSLVLPT